MQKCDVVIIGSGHLAYRVEKLAIARGYSTVHFHANEFALMDTRNPGAPGILHTFQHIDLEAAKMIYVIDNEDNFNLEVLLALTTVNQDLPITAALFNEKMAPHLSHAHSRLHILNPARIAAPAFVRALYEDRKPKLHYKTDRIDEKFRIPEDSLLQFLVVIFIGLILAAIVYFHFREGLSWIDSLYFVVVTITSVGYGDFNLKDSSSITKIAGIVLMLCSTVFIGTIFSLVIDNIIKKRIQRALGRKKYYIKNHVVVCGLGRLGYFIARELISRKEKVLIVEADEDNHNIPYFRSLGADIYIGDARLPRVLQDIAVQDAKGLISVINNDYGNLEIGLNARSFCPGLKLILRFFDESMGKTIRDRLDIYHTLSMSDISDEKFIETIG
jgi:voltage-gated potassium channel Kch